MYNYYEIDNLIHSVGIGDHPSDGQVGTKGRVNAHAITLDGKHYIYGIGGYEGKGIENAIDLATYLDEEFATKDEVATAIANAITNTLNTEV
jgi:hypothetical protein